MKKSKLAIVLKYILLFILAAPVVAMTFLTISNSRKNTESSPSLQIYAVSYLDESEVISISGKIASNNYISVTTEEVGLRVSELNVSLGDMVEKGQLIARLDIKDISDELSELNQQRNFQMASNQRQLNRASENKEKTLAVLNASIEKAESDYQEARKSCEEDAKNCEGLTGLQASLLELRSEYAVRSEELTYAIEDAKTLSEYDELSARINALSRKINASAIYAPESGMITRLNIAKGSVVDSEELADIQIGDGYKITASIPEANILKLKIGMPAEIAVVATGERQYTGKITKISKIPSVLNIDGVSNSNSPSYSAEITINESNTDLLVGMTATGNIRLQESEKSLVIPYDAIHEDEDGQYVYLMKDKNGSTQIEYRRIVAEDKGEVDRYYIPVLEGLSERDKVLVTSQGYDNGYVFAAGFLEENATYIDGL